MVTYLRIAVLLLMATVSQATTVVVNGTIQEGDGNPATGKLKIAWDYFTTNDGINIRPGSKEIDIGANGAFTVRLHSTTNAAESDVQYTVTYRLSGVTHEEYWSVPSSGPVDIKDIYTATQTTATTAISITQISGATDDRALIGSGTEWEAKEVPDCDTALTSKLLYDQTTNSFSCGTDQGGAGTGHTIQDEGVSLTQRTNLNFVGAGVTCTDDAGNDQSDCTISAGGDTDATYITQVAEAGLSAEQAMGALATGIVKNTTTTGVQSIAGAADIGVLSPTLDDTDASVEWEDAADLGATGALSVDVVAAAEMADADHGDVAWSGGVATVQAVDEAAVTAHVAAIDHDALLNFLAGEHFLQTPSPK
jgi:hypothetical protein